MQPPSIPPPPRVPSEFGHSGYPSVPPVAPPSMPPKKKSSGVLWIVGACLAGAGLLGVTVMGSLAYYGVKRYVQNSRMAAARVVAAKHVPRAEGRTYRDDEGFSIQFPAAPNASTREEHDGEMRVSVATLETGPTQFGAGKTEIFGPERYDCREVLAAMQGEMLKAVKCRPTSSTPSDKKLDFTFDCETGVRGVGRLVCDSSEVERARRGRVYTAMYYAVPKAFSETEARRFVDSMKTR